eukprot:7983216-Lingulodinium_polyedra.AAC.1
MAAAAQRVSCSKSSSKPTIMTELSWHLPACQNPWTASWGEPMKKRCRVNPRSSHAIPTSVRPTMQES